MTVDTRNILSAISTSTVPPAWVGAASPCRALPGCIGSLYIDESDGSRPHGADLHS